MTCDDRDSDLLLFAHGELNLVASTRTRLHVQRCDKCRKRINEFGLVSAAFAAALGPSAAERPKVSNPRPVSMSTSGSKVLMGTLIAIIGIAIFFAVRSAVALLPPNTQVNHATPSGHPNPAIIHSKQGCRPGIVSDVCR